MTAFIARPPLFPVWCVNLAFLGTEVVVLHRAHMSGFCSALEQLPHSVVMLSLSAAASCVLGIWCL